MKYLKSLHKRVLVFFLLLIIILSYASAGNPIGQFFTGLGTTLVGGILMATGVGAAAGGALIGVGFGTMVDAGVNIEKEKAEAAARLTQEQQAYISAYNDAYNNYLNAQQLSASLEANITDTRTGILQTEANISAFDQSLVRWQSQYDQQMNQLQMEGEASYSQLMQNWQGVELVNATRGQTGGSAALVAESQLDQVERLAGSDLRLDSSGGLFGTSLTELRLDMLAGRNELVGNMNIQKQALAKYQSALSSYKTQLASAESLISTSWNQALKARQDALSSGVSASLVGGAR